jgi:hypothetical protein
MSTAVARGRSLAANGLSRSTPSGQRIKLLEESNSIGCLAELFRCWR